MRPLKDLFVLNTAPLQKATDRPQAATLHDLDGKLDRIIELLERQEAGAFKLIIWIEVSQLLPEVGLPVLILCTDGQIRMASINERHQGNSDWWWDAPRGGDMRLPEHVTAWLNPECLRLGKHQ